MVEVTVAVPGAAAVRGLQLDAAVQHLQQQLQEEQQQAWQQQQEQQQRARQRIWQQQRGSAHVRAVWSGQTDGWLQVTVQVQRLQGGALLLTGMPTGR